MIFTLVNMLRGYLVILAEGNFLERFINLAVKNRIFLWDIRKISPTAASMRISLAGFKRIQKAARATGTAVKISEKRGLPNFLNKHRKRKAFFLGILLFALITGVLCSFIWSVEITGTVNIDENRLRDELRECGISAGSLKYGHSAQKIKREMMLKNSDIAWIWVDIRGTRAFVELTERTEKPEVVPENEPCNIIAARDGVITDMTVLRGKPVVSAGDVGKKGDLLISGVDDISHNGPVTYHSEGGVYALTWHEDEGIFPLEITEKKKTGETQTRFFLKIGGAHIPVYPFSKIPFEKYDSSTDEKILKLWGDLYLPVSFNSEKVWEYVEEKRIMSAEEACGYYAESLCKKIENDFGDKTEIINKDTSYEAEGDSIYVKCSLQCREDIGVKARLYKNDMEETVD